MTGTLSSRILAAIKANPGKSSLEISLLLTNVTRKQVAKAVRAEQPEVKPVPATEGGAA